MIQTKNNKQCHYPPFKEIHKCVQYAPISTTWSQISNILSSSYGANAKLSMNLSSRILFFVCFYSSVSSENTNGFQTPLIPWKIAQGKTITKALKAAKLTCGGPRSLVGVCLRVAAATKAHLSAWWRKQHCSSNISELPLGNYRGSQTYTRHALIFFVCVT